MWYMGEEFNVKENKGYKTLEGGMKAAQKNNLNLYDADGNVVYKKDKPVATLTDNVPEGALDVQPDGSVNTYDADGNPTGTATAVEVEAAANALLEEVDGVQAVRISGRVRRIFDGVLRLRKYPSWEAAAACGVTSFTEMKVTHLLEVDGKQMYRTANGYYISGEPEHVEYIEE